MTDLVLNRGLGAGAIPCRSCRKPIVFAVMYSSGKKAPFEIDPDGEWCITNGIAKHAGKPTPQADMFSKPTETRWTSHFARCADAATWRAPKERGE